MTDTMQQPTEPGDALAGVTVPQPRTRLAAALLALYQYSQEPGGEVGASVGVVSVETNCAPDQMRVNLRLLQRRGLVSCHNTLWQLTDLGVAAVWRLFGTGPDWSTLRNLVRELGPVRTRTMPRTEEA